MSKFREYDSVDSATIKYFYFADLNLRDIRSLNNSDEVSGEGGAKEDIDEGWNARNHSQLSDRISRPVEAVERIQSSKMANGAEVRECLEDSFDCLQTCTETMIKCLAMGGKYARPEHVNLLLDCARICNTNADFILRNSIYFPQICGMTADICDECADNCDRFDDDFMRECANVCRHCAESCREMAG